jgi:prepilin-type N-terminal cleavage/methylation domain-containing protein
VASSNFQTFIADPRIKKTLSTRPGDEGFSLIELVVVIAVLAILSAVALPNFLGVQKDGQIAAAKNTLATIVKECVTSGLRGTGTSFASVQSTQGKLNGYTMASLAATGATNNCYNAIATGTGDLPDYVISYNTSTGATAKTCSTAKTDYLAGCFENDTLAKTVTAGNEGNW